MRNPPTRISNVCIYVCVSVNVCVIRRDFDCNASQLALRLPREETYKSFVQDEPSNSGLRFPSSTRECRTRVLWASDRVCLVKAVQRYPLMPQVEMAFRSPRLCAFAHKRARARDLPTPEINDVLRAR